MASIKVPTLLQYLVYFQLLSLSLPNHWIKQFFLAQMYLELQLNDEALRIYQELEENGFHKSSYIVAQVAVAFHNMRGMVSCYLHTQENILTKLLGYERQMYK